MARNTQVAADTNAPPITRILAEFVAEHPSRGWSDAVDHGPIAPSSTGWAVPSARRATKRSKPRSPPCGCSSPRRRPACWAEAIGSTWATRPCSTASARTPSISTTPPEDNHPSGRPGGLRAAGTGRAQRRQRTRAARRAGARHRRGLPARQHGLPRALRPRLAHHRQHRHFRRGGRLRRLLGLDADRTQMALGIAASQPVGLREQFGTMTKPFHPAPRHAPA